VAAPGDLDTAFNGTGKTTFRYGMGQDDVLDMLALPDGKTVVAGMSRFGFDSRGVMVRYNPDGTMDNSFGIAGKFVSPVYQFAGFSSAGLTQDGKIIVLSDFNVGRVNTDGTLDTGFGANGIVQLPPGRYSKVKIQPDGKILIAGNDQTSSTCEILLVRLNADGSLDQSFGTGGLFRLENGGRFEQAADIAIDADGSIVAVGSRRIISRIIAFRALIVKLTANGSLDSSFGTNGRAVFTTGTDIGASRVAIQSDGRIVAGGGSFGLTSFFLRCDANGNIDTSFNGTGVVSLPSVQAQFISKMFLQPDGKILAAMNGGLAPTVVVRLTATGALDRTFGSRGMRAVEGIYATAAALRPDGLLALGGREASFFTAGSTRVTDINVVTIDSGGALDTEFGTNGRAVTDVGELFSYNAELLIQPDGKPVSIGALNSDTFYSVGGIGIARYNTDGTRDTTFAGDGATAVNQCLYSGLPPTAALQGGKIVVGCGNLSTHMLVRFNSDGSIDPGFGLNGVSSMVLNNSIPVKIVVQPDGKILSYTSNNFLYRFESGGALDNTFGTEGRIFLPLPDYFNNIRAFIVQPDGKFLLGGYTRIDNTGSNYDLLLARFNPDGSADSGFGSNGVTLFDSGAPYNDYGFVFLLGSDGKITVVGHRTPGGVFSYDTIEAVRFMPDGQLDVEFGQGGFTLLKSNPNNFAEHTGAYSAALQSNGKVIIYGVSNAIGEATTRLDIAGNVDAFWGVNGWSRLANIDASPPLQTQTAMKMDQNGNVVIATSNSQIVLMRRLKTGENGVALIAGRVRTALGRSIINAQISVSDGSTVLQTTYSGANGRYFLRNLPTGQTYTVTVGGRRYTFAQPSVNIALGQDEYGVDFVAN
jgi:uncharacterized delta-60 repeat protein